MSSLESKQLVTTLLEKRVGRFGSIKKIFAPFLEDLSKEAGLSITDHINSIVYNILNDVIGRGECKVCSSATKLYPERGGWASYCSMSCGNSKNSLRHVNAEKTKALRGTGIGADDIRQKSLETLMANYGVNNPSKSDSIVEKRKQVFLDKYGVSSAFKVESVKNKISETMLHKYGGTGMQSSIISKQIISTRRNTVINDIQVRLGGEWEVVTESNVWGGTQVMPLEMRHSCGELTQSWVWCGAGLFEPRCPICHKSSRPQQKIISMLTDMGIDNIIINDRSIIKPKELDIVIPSRKIAIEVNGLFFHGELSGKNRTYHLEKTTAAESAGYQLLHFTDLEINTRPIAIEHMLKSKLGKLDRIFARKTECRKISKETADEFLNKYHMGGATRASVRLGLFSGNTLVAVMTFGKSRFSSEADIELLRYASSVQVVGGASKLLHKFKEGYKGSILSFADRRWSTGKMYEALGFTRKSATPPNYWYYKGKQFHHRSKFQKHKIDAASNLTEWQLMKNDGWNRIWDSGSIKYILEGENIQ